MSDVVALQIKILHSGDRAILDNVAPGVFDHALDPRLVAEFLGDERHHVVVAVDRGEVIGFASGVHYVHPDKPAELWIRNQARSHYGKETLVLELLVVILVVLWLLGYFGPARIPRIPQTGNLVHVLLVIILILIILRLLG